MKAGVFFLTAAAILLFGCAQTSPVDGSAEKADDFSYARESGNFSDTGAIALHEGGYRFTIILVKDLEWALKSLEIADYGLPRISQFKRGEKVSPFLTFMTFGNENVNLTYSIRLQGPDGRFAAKEYRNLLIARSKVNESMGYPAKDFVTVSFDETDALGKYEFYVIVKDGENIKNACIMRFELTE